MKLKLFFSLLCGITLTAHSQNADTPSLPPGPLIQKRAPEFSQWVIKATNGARDTKKKNDSSSSPPPGSEQEKPTWGSLVAITKTGKVMLRQITDDKKRVWNTWCIDALQTTISPDGKSWIVQSKIDTGDAPTANYENYSQSDFPGFEWISQKNYVGIKSYQGKSCLMFEDQVALNGALTAGTVDAYIDVETRYPIAIASLGELHQYEFMAPPQTMLTPPAIIQELLDNQRKVMNSATRRTSR